MSEEKNNETVTNAGNTVTLTVDGKTLKADIGTSHTINLETSSADGEKLDNFIMELSKDERHIEGFPEETEVCFNNHLGAWMIETGWMTQAVSMIKSGVWYPKAAGHEEKRKKARTFAVQKATAIIPIIGPMMKFDSKFGGANTILIRQQLRQAANDSRISSILLHIDSPGGTVAGTKELADDVAAVNQKKPVFAQIDDMGASAAFWVASQARMIFANATAMVGSIGTVVVIEDTSEAFERAGIKVHVISTGEHKGAFAEGTEVTKSQLSEARNLVNDLNEHFLTAVKAGRDFSDKHIKAISDGRIFIGQKAVDLGLIDGVQSLDQTLQDVVAERKMERI